MAADHFEIVTGKTLREKAAAKFGLNQPSILDSVDRSKYATDEEYLDAIAREEALRKSPVYQSARRRASFEMQKRNEKAKREEQREEFKRIRADMELFEFEEKAIDEKALELARRDVVAGRISASGMGRAVEDYTKALKDEKLNEKSSNALFNKLIRGQM